MRKIIWLVLVSILVSGAALAQTTEEHRGYGYGFTGPVGATAGGAPSAGWQFGIGAERIIHKGIGVGGELSYLGPLSAFGRGAGVASVNGSYNFLNATSSRKVAPFVTAGYSLFFRSDTANGFNVGGGINYWFKERLGARFEVRDQVVVDHGFKTNFIGFRVGLTFR